MKRGAVVSAQQLGFTGAEILQYRLLDTSPAVGIALKELRFPRDAVIGAVIKGRGVETPGGQTVLKPGDEVLVFALPSGLAEIDKFFTVERRKS